MSQLLNLKRELLSMQQNGRKFLAIEKLLRYCDLEDEHDSQEAALSEQDASYQHKMAIWREDVATGREGLRTINESAFHALKTLILVSGGSAAAVLAFLGSVWSVASAAAREFFASALGWFGVSLIGAAIAYGLTYLCFLCYFELEWHKRGNLLRMVVILLVLACYGFLGLGLLQAFHGIHR